MERSLKILKAWIIPLLIVFWSLKSEGTALAEMAGHAKVFPSLRRVSSSDGKSVNSRSLVLDARMRDERSLFEGELKWAYGLSLSYMSESQSTTEPGLQVYRIKDLKRVVHAFAEDKGRVRQNLDRLLWETSFDKFDLSLGRQAFAYGVARIANPSDVFAPFPLQRIDQEFRLGIDGARLSIPLGELSEWEWAVIFGEKASPTESAALTRYKTQMASVDTELILIHFRKAQLLGFNLEGSLAELGLRAEGAIVKPKEEDSYLRVVLGGAYMFEGGSVLDLEYYHNRAGAKNRFEYPELWTTFAYTQGGVFFQGQHYLSTSLNHSLNPLLNGTAQFVANLSDGTMLTVIQLNYNSTENSYLDFGCFLSPTSRGKDEVFQGEFASLGQQIYASARYYW